MFTKRIFLLFWISILLGNLLFSSEMDQLDEPISRKQIQSIIEFLSHDLLEGRAPGTRGGALAEEYMKSVFKLLDIEPYGGEYFQEFTLKGFTTKDLRVNVGGSALMYGEEAVGGFIEEKQSCTMSGEAVFAGFGIVADDWDWNDYKDVSVKDKIVFVRVNEPAPENPESFEGQALTYYGRWIYKIEEAARQGAKGIILIHTTQSAGYGWRIVKTGWFGEKLYLPSTLKSNLLFRGWITEKKFKEVLATHGFSMKKLYANSETPVFRPMNLGFQVEIKGENSFRSFQSRNVVGYIPGNDPVLKKKAVIISAHIDHLGRNPDLHGDNIFNGAIDNGSAVASMIVTAQLLKKYQKNLKFSIIALACEAEESGLLGSHYFANSICPEDVIANINFESTPVREQARDIIAIGGKYSTLEDILKVILKKEKLTYSYYSNPNKGFFYRSDQFSFARKGIPSIWISAGEDYPSGINRIKEFFDGNYHTPRDEYDPNWELQGTIQTIQIAFRLIEYLNQYCPEVKWKGKMPFPVD